MNLRNTLGCLVLAVLVFGAGCSSETPLEPAAKSAAPAVLGVGGVNLVADGTGLMTQPSSFDINIPVADGADILSATFYWSGRAQVNTGDPTIEINGVEHVGTLLSSFPVNGGARYAFFYKLDGLALVAPGLNNFEVEGFNLGTGNLSDGIGLAVIYNDDASPYQTVQVLEPTEFIYWDDPDYFDGAVNNFVFDPDVLDRQAELLVFVGDAVADRPDQIWWESGAGDTPPATLIGGPYAHIDNQLVAANGPQFDVFRAMNLLVPGGAGHFAYQLESPDDGNGDSMLHSFAALLVPNVPPPPPPGEGCFWTIGFWKHEFNVALGQKEGRQHLTDEELTDLLAAVVLLTDIDYDGGDGVISFEEADSFLDIQNGTKCERALQQFLATLLNYAWNGDGTLMVDTDYDGIPDTEFDDAIEAIEDLILGASGEDDSDCTDAKDMADSINNMHHCDIEWGSSGEKAIERSTQRRAIDRR